MWSICIIYITCLISAASGLECLNCPTITHPRFCEHVEECNQGETCWLKSKANTFGEVEFTLGCKPTQMCDEKPSSNQTSECQECCNSDICNTHGCGETDTTFSNVNACYRCDGQLTTDFCRKIGYCKDTELCFTKGEFRNGEVYMQYGCMAKTVCDIGVASKPVFGKRAEPNVRCCSGNLCNNKPIPAGSITTMRPTTKPITTMQPVTTVSTVKATEAIPSPDCNSTKEVSPINCNFESPKICDFLQDKSDNIDWFRHSGTTSSLNTGPSSAYNTLQGHYMYLEASIVEKKGDTARLLTPQITPSMGQCLSFWYNMYGYTMGTLNVYAASDLATDLNASNRIGSISGNQGQSWHQKCIPMTTQEPMNIVFEGVAGNGYTGDIAIDDIQLNMGCPCLCNGQNNTEMSPSPMTASVSMPTPMVTNTPSTSGMMTTETTMVVTTQNIMTTTTTQPPVPTSPTKINSTINCDFETPDICNFIQESNETHDWMRNTGSTNSLNTGPTADHTYKTPNGHYMYLETSNALKKGEIARLWTPTITPSTGQCLSFWYNMYGFTVGSLKIYTANNSTGTPVLGNPVCTITGNQGHPWHQECTVFPDSQSISVSCWSNDLCRWEDENITVVFEAETGDGFTGDIALDDVNLNFKCPCKDTCS